MKILTVLSATVALLGAATLASPAARAVPSEHLDWGQELAASETSCPAGQAVINVVHKVINDMDSGTGGNFWAFDEYVRQIEVVQTGDRTFCASVRYQGNFETVAGPSPQNTGNVGDGVVGTFQGGYTATITGTLSPTDRTKGSLGTFDYQCDPFTGPGDRSTCTGLFNWLDAYFAAGWGFVYEWWGWVYHAGNNGSWVNAASGNSGDITGN